MKTELTKKGYIIHKTDDLTPESIKLIENELSVKPDVEPIAKFIQPPAPYPVYRVNSKRYRVPRHWGFDHFGQPTSSIPNGIEINVPFNGTLKTETKQPEAAHATITAMRSIGGGILCLPTGYGKTSTSLYIISQMKVKTLVIVHKEFLMSQWKERIQQFLPDAEIGIIQQNKVDINGKDIVIGMLQSLSMKEYPEGTFDTFGLMVIDEVHHICTKTFSCALMNVCTKYTLGLSATPYRKDGLTKVIKWFIGDICFSVERQTKKTIVNIVNFKCDHYQNEMPTMKGGKVSIPIVINQLVDIDERNEKILEVVKKYIEIGRKIILLSDRRHHCEFLCKKCKEFTTSGLYMGGMPQHALKESEECNVICATYSLAQEGLDIPALDTCILATPKTDVVQACGRVMRETKGKKFDPIIVDIVDIWGVLMGQAKKRKKFYTKSEFTIEGREEQREEKETTVSGFQFVEE